MSNIDLTKNNVGKLAVRYLIPSIAGMIGLSMCIFFDTMFIGKGIGDIGLAALNIVIPIFSVFTSIYLLLGVGGATVVSICIGKGRYKDISGIFTMCVSIGATLGVILIILRFLFLDKISILLGATTETFPLVKDYLGIVLIAGIGFIISGILNIFVRNDGNPRLSMWSTIGANITNIVLDYIFIFPLGMGMKGAALATGLSTIIGISILSIHFFSKKNNLHFNFINLPIAKLKRVVRNGLPSFIAELSCGIVIFIFNVIITNMIGNIGVSAYSIISNSSLIVLAIFNGIAQGMQPIAGVNYGAKLNERVRKIFKIACIVSLVISISFYLIGAFKPTLIINIFSTGNEELISITKIGILIYYTSFMPMGLNVVNIAYLQSIERAKYSSLLSILRGIILSITLVLILSNVFGIIGVWLAIPLAELLTLIVSFIFINKV